ncbi:rhodanese-like domain-containing protein [Halobacteriovorax sp.]|uniref:rhodanese-like domain-containing protein n=1 Tax=Halobacteriovorax sp. TaxID=2020862 RepID=UPI003AF22CF8
MKAILLITLSLFITSCSALNATSNKEAVKESYTLESTKLVNNLAIAAQPSKKTLNNVQKEGYEIVVNLRNPNEFKDYNEAKYVSEMNLKYYNIPFFDKKKNINKRSLSLISKLLKDNKDKKVFIHCSSGNRAAAWYLSHLYIHENMSLEDATKIARNAGLTKPGLERMIRNAIKDK